MNTLRNVLLVAGVLLLAWWVSRALSVDRGDEQAERLNPTAPVVKDMDRQNTVTPGK